MEPKISEKKVREVIQNEIKLIKNLMVKWEVPEDGCELRIFGDRRIHKSPPRQEVKHQHRGAWNSILSICRVLLWVGVVTLFILSCHKPTQKFIIRHTQHMLYPVMRIVRIYTIPILMSFPYLSEWYDEECLAYNQLYQASSKECWLCSDVKTIIDLTGLRNISNLYYKTGNPFLVKDVQNTEVSYQQLKQIYSNNKENLQKGTSSVKSNLPGSIQKVHDLFTFIKNPLDLDKNFKNLHVTWKVTRVPGVHVLRQIFEKPYFIPSTTEVAMQRFLFIDGPQASAYNLPISDFANVWITQASGHRFIILTPSSHCSVACPSLPIILEPKDVLFFNSQLWKAQFMPMSGTGNVTISFMGSFY